MEKMKFTINIFPSGESELEFPVTAKEKRLILEAVDNGDMFEDVDELSDLYERVMDAAGEKLQDDLDLTGDDYPDDIDYNVDFCQDGYDD